MASRSDALRFGAMLALVIAGGGGITYCLLPPAKKPAAAIPSPRLRVAGQELPATGDVLGAALDAVRKFALGDAKLKLPNGKEIKLTRADFGIEIDRLRLAEFIKAAEEKGSALSRAHALADKPDEPLDVPLPITIDTARAVAKLVDVKADVDTLPVDAIIDLDARKVKPEQPGYRLDVYGTIANVETAFRAGQTTVDAAVEVVQPKRTAAELEGVNFDHVLGFFETRYTRGAKFEDRAFNLHQAASRLDGTVLMPGETFDFNAVVGPRDEAHGYRVAKVIAEGELVDGIGGGTCQISGTLYGAVLFAGLDVVERYPHSRPSAYIQLGLDATVAYPNITFRFKNPFEFPIVLHEKVSGGVVHAEILGKERKLTTTFFRRIDEMAPFEEVERDTPKLKKGDRVVVQRGIPGFVATASRVVRDGAYADRTKWTEKYPPVVQIVDVGTGPDDTQPGVVEDAHPEYTLDEYLVMTQGPNVRGAGAAEDDGSGMIIQPIPGRTREAGWMKKLGFEKTPIEGKPEGDADVPGEGDKPKRKKGKHASGKDPAGDPR